MDYKELKAENDRLKNEIDTFHAFYENFNMYDLVISNGNGLLSEMMSELLRAKKKNPNLEAVINQEKRINGLFDIFSEMQGLNNKSQSLSLRFKFINQRCFNLEHELKSIKMALEND